MHAVIVFIRSRDVLFKLKGVSFCRKWFICICEGLLVGPDLCMWGLQLEKVLEWFFGALVMIYNEGQNVRPIDSRLYNVFLYKARQLLKANCMYLNPYFMCHHLFNIMI